MHPSFSLSFWRRSIVPAAIAPAALIVALIGSATAVELSFDGSYAGSAALSGGIHTDACADSVHTLRLQVLSGALIIPTTPLPSLLPISPTGGLSGSDAAGRFIIGHIDGGKLTADVRDGSCIYAWTLYRE